MEDNNTQLIINARVIDGAGQAPFDGAIAVQGNRILSVVLSLVYAKQSAQARRLWMSLVPQLCLD